MEASDMSKNCFAALQSCSLLGTIYKTITARTARFGLVNFRGGLVFTMLCAGEQRLPERSE